MLLFLYTTLPNLGLKWPDQGCKIPLISVHVFGKPDAKRCAKFSGKRSHLTNQSQMFFKHHN